MTSHEKRTLVVKFRIEGNLRFLSHQETMTMWSRALARSGWDVCFSSGYNPHPRFSLPLPRSVGVRSDDELLCALVSADDHECGADLVCALQSRLPEGCVVTAVELCEGKVSFQPAAAVYEFPLHAPAGEDMLNRVSLLNASAAEGREIIVQRRAKEQGLAAAFDAGPFIISAALEGGCVTVHCRITPGGAVRIDEIMELLGLGAQDVSGGVLRKSVQWERN